MKPREYKSMTNKQQMNTRRFSDDQIKSLETTFQAESRPELRLKHHLANRLGLHPRQVAIWFQNKRARSKSKEIEREYTVLKSSYDKLVAEFNALREQNQALLIQLQGLRVMAGERDGEENDSSKNEIALADTEEQRFLREIKGHELCVPSSSSDILNRKEDYLDKEVANVLDMDLIAEGSLTSMENGCSFESCTFLDNSGGRSQWWDFLF